MWKENVGKQEENKLLYFQAYITHLKIGLFIINMDKILRISIAEFVTINRLYL